MARYRARRTASDGRATDFVCQAFGRLFNGQLGMLQIGGVFRPLPQVVGSGSCGVESPSGYAGEGNSFRLARVPETPCTPEDPALTRLPACEKRDIRTIRNGILGRGILDLAVKTRQDQWRRVPLWSDGAFILAQRGLYTDRTIPPLRVTATLCGPDARRDLLALYHAVRRGCTVTYEIPTAPRPVRESAASKRARRAGHLNIPVHVEKDSHESTIGRYWIAFRIPITIETALENYGWRLSGPAAPRCVHNNTSSATSQSYLWVAGRRLRLVLGPPSTRPAWCPGRYTVKVVFVEKYSVPPRRGHRPVLRTRTRTLGTTSFTVSARGY